MDMSNITVTVVLSIVLGVAANFAYSLLHNRLASLSVQRAEKRIRELQIERDEVAARRDNPNRRLESQNETILKLFIYFLLGFVGAAASLLLISVLMQPAQEIVGTGELLSDTTAKRIIASIGIILLGLSVTLFVYAIALAKRELDMLRKCRNKDVYESETSKLIDKLKKVVESGTRDRLI